MPDRIDPTVRDRIARLLSPDLAQTALARRIVAGLLVCLAAVSALRPDPDTTYTDVAVATRDLSPGRPVGADDVRLEKRSRAVLPDGALTRLDQILGATVAGTARRGEVLTDARVLSARLAGLSAGPDARIVPLHLADAAVLDVVRPGDVVDVLGAGPSSPEGRPRMLAAGAVVVGVSAAARNPGAGEERVVLVALPVASATAVAGASLVQSVTLTFH